MMFSLPILWRAARRELGLHGRAIGPLITRLLRSGALVEFRLGRESALYGRELSADPTVAVTGLLDRGAL